MRLFHFSEDGGIEVFEPVGGRVWAIDDQMSVNYLFPRECPRVTVGLWESTNETDRVWFESRAAGSRRIVLIESGWLDQLRSTSLFRYEFEPSGFELNDRSAGYWTSALSRVPMGKERITDLGAAIDSEGGNLVCVASLWPTIDRVVGSSLRFSVIREWNALPRDFATST